MVNWISSAPPRLQIRYYRSGPSYVQVNFDSSSLRNLFVASAKVLAVWSVLSFNLGVSAAMVAVPAIVQLIASITTLAALRPIIDAVKNATNFSAPWDYGKPDPASTTDRIQGNGLEFKHFLDAGYGGASGGYNFGVLIDSSIFSWGYA